MDYRRSTNQNDAISEVFVYPNQWCRSGNDRPLIWLLRLHWLFCVVAASACGRTSISTRDTIVLPVYIVIDDNRLTIETGPTIVLADNRMHHPAQANNLLRFAMKQSPTQYGILLISWQNNETSHYGVDAVIERTVS